MLQGQKAEARVRGDVWDWQEFHKESIKSQNKKKKECSVKFKLKENETPYILK